MSGRARTPYALLAMLSLGPRSGYDIRRGFHASIGHFWNESNGQLYPGLKGLVAAGLAEVRPSHTSSGRRRRLYAITPRGRSELRRWLERPPARLLPRNELMLKLFVGWHAPSGAAIGHVERFKAEIQDLLRQFTRIERHLVREARTNTDVYFWLLTLHAGKEVARARLRWCDAALAELRKPRRKPSTAGVRRSGEMGEVLRRIEQLLRQDGVPAGESPRRRRQA